MDHFDEAGRKGEHQLRSKRELIEQFIAEHVPELSKGADVGAAFEGFWNSEKLGALNAFATEEGPDEVGLNKAIDTYLYSGRMPIRDDLLGLLNQRPRLSERKTVAERVLQKMREFIDRFIEGMG